jgi:uncharacterized membrane protein YfcA
VTLSLAWLVGAFAVLAASFVQGLTGFGLGLVALSFLPYLMPPSAAVVLITIYGAVFAIAVLVQLRRDVTPGEIVPMLIGTVVGMPFGVWVLASVPGEVVNRIIGFVLVAVALLEWRGLYPGRLHGWHWGLGAGMLSGLLGGGFGTPGPPVILYSTTQGWSPRTIKANLQAFFALNQAVILAGHWWAGLLTVEVATLALAFAVPGGIGLLAGVLLFGRIDHAAFRRIIFMVIFASGAVLLIRG